MNLNQRMSIGQAAILFVIMLTLAGNAATYYVDIGRAGLSLNTGANWADAYTNLQSALAVAGTNDQVWVAKGTYYPTNGTDRTATFNMRGQVLLYGGFINGGSMADRNWNVNTTVLSGDIGSPGVNTDNCYHVVTANNKYDTIDGFTIRDGYNYDTPYVLDSPTNLGAGVLCMFSAPSNILNCTFINNAARGYGGGLFIAFLSAPGPVSISNCLFIGNTAGYGGGGLYHRRGVSLNITHCGFYNNTGVRGGGALQVRVEDWAKICTFNYCRFVGNSAGVSAPYGGGAMLFDSAGQYIIKNTLFAGNQTSAGFDLGRGGAVFAILGNVQIESCNLVGNVSYGGGAIAMGNLTWGGQSMVFLTNSILWDNISYNANNGNNIWLYRDSTAYVGYACSQGGLVWPAVSNAAPDSCIIYDQGGNIAGDPSLATNLWTGTWKADAVYSSNTAQTVLTDSSAAWTINGLVGYMVNPHTGDRRTGNNSLMFHIVANSATALTVWGNASAGTNASSYAINDYRLRQNSPCINAGLNLGWMIPGSVDLDGRGRIDGFSHIVDIGAYEFWPKGTLFTVR